jgi:ATP-dependent RNA helicase DDX6/DHH1
VIEFFSRYLASARPPALDSPLPQFPEVRVQSWPAPQGLPEASPQGLPQGLPEALPQGSPKGLPKGLPQDFAKGSP